MASEFLKLAVSVDRVIDQRDQRLPTRTVGQPGQLLVRLRRELFQVGLVAATVFVVGVGLPGGSEAAAYTRFWLVLAGGSWALLGAFIQWMAQRHSAAAQNSSA